MDDKKSTESKLNFKLKDVVEIIEQHKILSIIAATAYGYFYLFIYTTKKGIPFPIDNPNISMLVIAIAVGVFLIFGLLISVILLPAFITGNELDPFYSQTNKMLLRLLIYFRLIGWSVIFAFLVPLLVIHLESLIPKRITLLGCLALFILCSFLSCLLNQKIPKENRKDFVILLVFIQFMFVVMTWLKITIILLFWAKNSLYNPNDIQFYLFYIFLMIFFLLYYYVFSLPKDAILRNLTMEKIVLMLLLIAFFIPINLPLVEWSMRAFNMGGGYEALYYVDDSQKETLPKEIIDTIDDKKTKLLIVLMSVGDKKYVKLKETQESARVYGLNLGKSNEVIIKKNNRQSTARSSRALKKKTVF